MRLSLLVMLAVLLPRPAVGLRRHCGKTAVILTLQAVHQPASLVRTVEREIAEGSQTDGKPFRPAASLPQFRFGCFPAWTEQRRPEPRRETESPRSLDI